MFKMKTIFMSLALAACSSNVAMAQDSPPCGPMDQVGATLNDRYNEFPVWTGLSGAGHVTQLWVDEEGGSWSVTTTTPDGITCLRDDGNMFQYEEHTHGEDM